VWLTKPGCRASLCNNGRKTGWRVPVGLCKFGGTKTRISEGTGLWMTYNGKLKTAFLCARVGSSHRQCKPSSFQKCWRHCKMSIGPGCRGTPYQVLNEVQTAITVRAWARIPSYSPFWYGSTYVTSLVRISDDDAFSWLITASSLFLNRSVLA